jgi:hypothetical protein
MYWILLVAAVVGLWRLRRRPRLLWPLVALAVAASVVVTTEAHTRYRAPLEPLIVVLACSNVPALAARLRARRRTEAGQGGEIAAAVP